MLSASDYRDCDLSVCDDLVSLESRILSVCSRDCWAPYPEIADQLDEIPWDVLDACRHLARCGVIIEGSGKLELHFRHG